MICERIKKQQTKLFSIAELNYITTGTETQPKQWQQRVAQTYHFMILKQALIPLQAFSEH